MADSFGDRVADEKDAIAKRVAHGGGRARPSTRADVNFLDHLVAPCWW